MPVKKYNVINGMIVGETNSARPYDYMTDALGSVIAIVSSGTGAVQTRYRYSGYGSTVLTSGIIGTPPKFQWVGGWGYRASSGLTYVRRRHYKASIASWATVDPLAFRNTFAPPFSYVRGAPVTRIDPSGLCEMHTGPPAECSSTQMIHMKDCCRDLENALGRINAVKEIIACIRQKYPSSVAIIPSILERMASICAGRRCLKILCPPAGSPPAGWPNHCPACNVNNIAATPVTFMDVLPNPAGYGVGNPLDDYPGLYCRLHEYNPKLECEKLRDLGVDCVIVMCPDAFKGSETCSTFYHEMIHCTSGLVHGGPVPVLLDFIYELERCIAKAVAGG